jgi:hypothetical protein
MKPITFFCEALIPKSGVEISLEIANMDKWTEFTGFWILPGIKEAKYEKRTAEMVGSRIAVCNMDGSTHTEEIYKWNPSRELGLKLMEFSPPLNRIATHFLEEWEFKAMDGGTMAKRSFALYAKSRASRPFLWIISLLFRRAIKKHLAQMAQSVS